MATATRTGEEAGFRSAEEMREILDRVFSKVNADEQAGPMLRATEMRLRLRFPDLRLAVNVGASADPDSCIEWDYSPQPPWEPKLELTMNAATANSYLQGALSVPVAIARGQVQCAGDARAALLYLPATKLITDPYRKLIESEYDHLAIQRGAAR